MRESLLFKTYIGMSMCRVKGCLCTQNSAHLCGSRLTNLGAEKSVPKISK